MRASPDDENAAVAEGSMPRRRRRLDEIDSLCDAFESAWQRGERPSLESTLGDARETLRPELLLELLHVELWYRRQAGEAPAHHEYARRFPGNLPAVDAAFALLSVAPTPGNAAPARATAASPVQDLTNAAQPARRSSHDFTLEIGAAFGRYQIERLLGEGAMGAVYLAVDTTLGRRVALKIPKFAADDAEARARFLREARLAASLHHSHICPIFDVGDVDGRQYLTMAFIEGRTLAAFIEPGKPLPPRQAALLIRKLALALAEAHAAGVVHRDLKPANIMVDKKNEPIVMDFGLARAAVTGGSGRLTQSGVIVGSPAYMAPEQADGDPALVGPSCDIYSLGIVLFELLTGRVPFEGTVMAVLMALASKPVPSPRQYRPEIDAALEAICRKMTAKHAENRYATMKEVSNDLKAYLTTPAKTPVNAVVPTRADGPQGLSLEDYLQSPLPAEPPAGPRTTSPSPPSTTSAHSAATGTSTGRSADATRAAVSPAEEFDVEILGERSPAPADERRAGQRRNRKSSVAARESDDDVEPSARPTKRIAGLSIVAPSRFAKLARSGREGFRTASNAVLGAARNVVSALNAVWRAIYRVCFRNDPWLASTIIVAVQIALALGVFVSMSRAARERAAANSAPSANGTASTETSDSSKASSDGESPKTTDSAMSDPNARLPGEKSPRSEPKPSSAPLPPLSLSELPPQLGLAPWRTPPTYPPPAVAPFSADSVRDLRERWAKAFSTPGETTNSIGMRLVLVPPGEYVRSLSQTVDIAVPGLPAKSTVRLSHPVYFGVTEVCWNEFRQFVDATGYKTRAERDASGGRLIGIADPPATSGFTWRTPHPAAVDARHPVGHISPEDARAFCSWLSQKDGATYRLPTEAEWEFAAIAGRTTISDITQEAWLDQKPVPITESPLKAVGSKDPNPLGIHDLIGGQLEWCDAEAAARPDVDVEIDPRGTAGSVCRGGSWAEKPSHYIGRRRRNLPVDLCCGFRVVREVSRRNDLSATANPEFIPILLDLAPGAPLSQSSLVRRPAAIPGLKSWSLELLAPDSYYGNATIVPTRNGRMVAVLNGGTILILDSELRVTTLLQSRLRSIHATQWASDDETIVVTGWSNSNPMVELWHVPSGRLMRSIALDYFSAGSVALSPNRRRLAFQRAVGHNDKTAWFLSLIDIENPRQRPSTIALPDRFDTLGWSSDGTTILAGGFIYRKERRCLTLCAIDAATLSVKARHEDQDGVDQRVSRTFKLSPDWSKLLIVNSEYRSGTTIEIWDLSSATRVHQSTPKNLYGYGIIGWLDDDRVYLTVLENNQIHLDALSSTDGEARRIVTPMSFDSPNFWARNPVPYGANGAMLAIVDGELTAVSQSDGTIRRRASYGILPFQDDYAWEPNQARLAVVACHQQFFSSTSSISLWNRSLDRRSDVSVPPNKVRDGRVRWTPAELFVVDRNDAQLHVIDPDTTRLKRAHTIGGGDLGKFVFSVDGTRLFVLSKDGSEAWIIDTANGVKKAKLKHQSKVEAFALSAGGDRFAALTRDRITIWSVPQGEIQKVITKLPYEGLENYLKDLDWMDGDRTLQLKADKRYRLTLADATWTETASKDSAAKDAAVNPRKNVLSQFRNGMYWILNDAGEPAGAFCPSIGIAEAVGIGTQNSSSPTPLNVTHWLAIGPDGHYRGSAKIEEVLRYVALHDDGRMKTYTPAEFSAGFSWRNDPSKAVQLNNP